MKGVTARALCVLSVSAALVVWAAAASAALLVGELDGVIQYASQQDVPDGTPFPFGLTSENGLANQGVPVVVRFAIDTALLPADQDAPSPTLFRFEDFTPANPWLWAELEVNGSTVPIDQRYLLLAEWHSTGTNGDGIVFGMGDASSPTTLQVVARAPDFGAGNPLWTSLDVDIPASPQSTFQFLYGGSSTFGLTFAVTHLELHTVPEPGAGALGWLALLALPLLRHRAVSG
jgi:hypothetical protein